LRSEGKAIVMSTHDIFRALEVADVIAIMDEGRIIMQKRSEEIAGQDLENLYLHHMAGRSTEIPA